MILLSPRSWTLASTRLNCSNFPIVEAPPPSRGATLIQRSRRRRSSDTSEKGITRRDSSSSLGEGGGVRSALKCRVGVGV